MGTSIAGAKYQGELEDRLKVVLKSHILMDMSCSSMARFTLLLEHVVSKLLLR